MQIIRIRLQLKRTCYALVWNDSLAALNSLKSQLDDITEQERLYLEYFKAYCLKKMGFLFEAREMLHQLVADAPILAEQIRFKVTIKLAKIYTELCNHFEARFYLRKLKSMLEDNIMLSQNLKLKAAYYQAKCKYYLNMGILTKLKKNVIKLNRCQEEGQIKMVQRISALNYQVMSDV